MKVSTITLALVSGMASIASAERPKSNAHINPMINDSAKPVSTVKEQGQRHLQGKSTSTKSGKSTSSTKSSKSKSSKSAGPCDMLGMGCTITAAAGDGLGDECAGDNAAVPPVLGVPANTVGNFTCNAGQPFGEGGSFLFNSNTQVNGVANSCLRLSNCGAQNATTQALTIPSDILDELIEQCEACEEVPPISLTCTDEFLFLFDGEVVETTLCGGITSNEADANSFNCASGRFVARGDGACFVNTPGSGTLVDGFITNRQAIIEACLQCPNVVTVPAVPAPRAQPVQQASSTITGSELRLSTPVAATKTTNGGVTISGVTRLSASMLAVAAFGMFIF